MSGLPKILQNFDVSISGTSFKKKCKEITLPSLKLKTEEWRGAGMDMPIDIELGMEKMEASLTFAGVEKDAFLSFGLSYGGVGAFNVTGFLKAQNEDVIPLEVVFQGGVKAIEPSAWKPGDIESSMTKLDISVSRYSLRLNEIPIVAIDAANGIRQIMGIDQLASLKSSLGV